MAVDNLRIAITCGDLNGVGLEVIIKTLSDSRIYQNHTPVIYASVKAVSHYRKLIGGNDFNFNHAKNIDQVIPKKINVINCWEEEVKIEPGVFSAELAKYAFKSFEMAVADIQSGKADVLITAPVNKQAVADSGIKFTGHTELLGEKFSSGEYLMLLVSDTLRVGVVTGHIPIQQVAANITVDKIVKKAKTMHASLRKDFGIVKPNIAILGLNPHAGDGGLIGKEENEIILPAVKKLIAENILAFGPYSADGFFGSGVYQQFDGILAMYHDQGLIPFKSIAFGSGVNFTAGLQIVRTSPDHGPAYDIAGKNKADESSFREALYMAEDIFSRRIDFKEMNANPLPVGFSKLGQDN